MKQNNNYENFSLAEFSVQELENFKKIAEAKQDKMIEAWGAELGEILREKGFDQYSRKGEKRLEKFTNKHAEILSDVLVTISMIDEELEKRGVIKYNRQFTDDYSEDDEDLSTEEFIQREQEKIENDRKYIDEE